MSNIESPKRTHVEVPETNLSWLHVDPSKVIKDTPLNRRRMRRQHGPERPPISKGEKR